MYGHVNSKESPVRATLVENRMLTTGKFEDREVQHLPSSIMIMIIISIASS